MSDPAPAAPAGVPVGEAARAVEGGPARPPGWLSAVAGALAQRVEETRRLWAGQHRAGTVHDYVDDVLAAPGASGRTALHSEVVARIDADPAIGALRRTFGLSRMDTEWLALLAAVETEPRLRRSTSQRTHPPMKIGSEEEIGR